ncbi:MAG: hypothetical protein H7X95_01210 [Deltaproteobacteria bacterium]|nr:hypothetical protein [Deltaproteobacteria bacterium]
MYRNAALATVLGLTALASHAHAAPAWVYRSIVLPQGDVALDIGFGLGHAPVSPNTSTTGFGLNLEIAAGISHNVQLGVRGGFRLDNGGQLTQADAYGRPFQTETYGTLFDRVANPEVHMRWAVARSSALELGLDLRAYLPSERGSAFGFMLGVPLSLHGGALRIDSGVYVPVIFYDPNRTVVSVPVHLWIQATNNLWLGPLFGIRMISGVGANQYPLGFGLGSSLNRSVDLRAWLLFPDMSREQATRTFGVGLALQLRFE